MHANDRVLTKVRLQALAVTLPLLFPAPAFAQQSPSADTPSQIQEITVTARKRNESILNVPVIETALPQQQLERLQIKDMKDIATLVPGLAFGDNVLSIGTQVSLRGVGTSSNDPGVDQSVSLNIDGLSLGNGLAFASGLFDAGQVEVLKGPQALFYGKSSPGGVISIRTADPTDKFEVIARGGYEFEAREKRGELIVSGPISDTMKARLAGYYSDQDGFFKNIVSGPIPPLGGALASGRLPASKNWMVRGTLLWNPASDFNARLKLNSAHDRVRDSGVYQLAKCPEGVGPVFGLPFINPAEDCHLDRKVSWVQLDPAAFPSALDHGRDFTDTDQNYGTLELNYRPAKDFTITSTTAYYRLRSSSDYPAADSSYAGPGVEATNHFQRREFTEELRANSDFAGPLNFTAGGFLERGRVADDVGIFGNTAIAFPAFLTRGTNIVHVRSESLFGQLRYKILPRLELAAGARWTDETRTNSGFLQDVTGATTPVVRPVPKINSKNVSPEVTLTYKPSSEATIFGSLKQGYKSGSFSIATPPVQGLDNSFGDEKVQGGEIGLKSRWLNRSLQFNIAGYYYKYSGLQVGAIVPVNNGVPLVTTVNAGSAITKGVEAELTYRPPQVPSLTLHADTNFNPTRYKKLNNIPCYGGQTVAQGCNLIFSPAVNNGAGGFTAQDVSGLPLIRAAKWQVNFGFDWETDLGNGMKVIVSNNQHFSSRMLVNLGEAFYQKSFIKSDLSLSLQGRENRWEISVIGKNLNNRITTGACVNANTQGGGLPGTEITGTNDVGPAGRDEIGCIADRGRELWLRLTIRPFG
jgi:iron complex outermembrane receptor protein